MAKATVYVCEHYTIEVDLDEVKELYGSTKNVFIEEAAWEAIPDHSPYLTTFVVEEIEKDEPVKKAKRGRGSY
jgi:hypothetical protein